MTQNFISILLANYNGETTIKRAIDSVLNQSYPNFELLIQDDCSTDSSIDIINNYKKTDNRIKLIINKENIGQAKTLQYLVLSAKHDWLARIDSDDYWHTEKLTKCLYNGQVYLSKPTRDLLEAIHNENYGGDNKNTIKKNQINTEDYEDSKIITHNGIKEKITFYPSEHVLGASQIEIVTSENKKIVYSGDITSGDEPPKNIHTLIIDSTHGHTQYQKY